MDPTFGHQEILDSLSQGSGGTKSPGGSSNKSSHEKGKAGATSGHKSSSSSTRSGGGGAGGGGGGRHGGSFGGGPRGGGGGSSVSNVDEAYRRLGHRLSLQAHGDTLPMSTSSSSDTAGTRLRVSQDSSFELLGGNRPATAGLQRKSPRRIAGAEAGFHRTASVPIGGGGAQYAEETDDRYRTQKVAKTGYSDHGEHHVGRQRSSSSLLRKLTVEAKERFERWETEQAARRKREQQQQQKQRRHQRQMSGSSVSSTSSTSPQRYALSQLALEGSAGSSSSRGSGTASLRGSSQASPSTSRRAQQRTNILGAPPPSKGLLSAVLEGHSDSNTSASGVHGDRSTHTSPSQSISTKDSKTALSSLAGTGAGGSLGSASSAPRIAISRGQCLTSPCDAVANDGFDNAEGNLIVYENDTVVVPRKSVHSIRPKSAKRQQSIEFRVQALLGQGTFAQVFQCLHVQTGEVVAVKIVKNKPAYTRQATVEIDVFRALQDEQQSEAVGASASLNASATKDYMVNLLCYFMHRSHLCLVFELLGLNLYEVLKRRQFRGLPLPIVRDIVLQSVHAIKDLSQKSIVHCDLKPENVLLISDEIGRAVVSAGDTKRRGAPDATAAAVTSDMGNTTLEATIESNESKATPSVGESKAASSVSESKAASSAGGSKTSSTGGSKAASSNTGTSKASSNTGESKNASEGKVSSGSSSAAATIQVNNRERAVVINRTIKLIDFGSACFEGYTAHTYIQSRFYRSPEVLLGLPYDSAIDMWSLGCVAAELFLGLPILPGVHEHDQLGRISEMISKLPDWMLDQGSKSTKFYVKFFLKTATDQSRTSSPAASRTPSPGGSPVPALPQWRLKTQKEYISSLSQSEIRKKGGLAKLEKQPGNRYFKRKKLSDILILHAQNLAGEDKEMLVAFVHFLYGLLDPDPWKRWTAFQAAQHPFLTGDLHLLRPKGMDTGIERKEENQANVELDVCWQSPWDPAICRRKLLNVQKMREKQQAMRRGLSSRPGQSGSGQDSTADRRRARRGDVSPSFGTPTTTTATTPLEGSPALARSGASPPNQISSSTSTGTSQRSWQPPAVAFKRQQEVGGASTSLNSLGNPSGMRSQVVVGLESASAQSQSMTPVGGTAGPQSFTGTGYEVDRAQVEVDFAHALRRPGVVPGAGGDCSVSSQLSAPQQHTHGGYQNVSGSFSGQSAGSQPLSGSGNFLVGQSIQMGQRGFSSANQQAAVLPGQMHPHYGYGGAFPSSAGSSSSHVGSQYGTSIISSANSSVTMPDVIDQQQISMLQQQQEQQMAMLQQQFVMAQQQSSYGMPLQGLAARPQQVLPSQNTSQAQQQQVLAAQQQFATQTMTQQQPAQFQQQQQIGYPAQQQQPGQPATFALQQQPIYLASAPGGGVYYVTTSAAGQPIILQPVAVLNQPLNPGVPQGSVHALQGQLPQHNVVQQQQQHQPPQNRNNPSHGQANQRRPNQHQGNNPYGSR